MKILRMAIVLLILSSSSVYGATPTETTEAFFKQLKKGDFEAAAALFYPPALTVAVTQAEAQGTANFDGMEILGEVMEGPDVAHVLTRNRVSVGDFEVETMEIVSCRKQGDEWKLLVSSEMKGLANQIRSALASVPR